LGYSFILFSINRLTCSLDCVIAYTKYFVCLLDQSLRQVIGIEYKSHGLCHGLFNVVAPRCQGSMVDYVGKVQAIFHEFNEKLPLVSTIA